MAQATRARTPVRGPDETSAVIAEGKQLVRNLRRDATKIENLPLGILCSDDVSQALEMISALRTEADEIEAAITSLADGQS